MPGYQSAASDASSRKRAYKEDEDVETTEDIFSPKFSYHLSRMHYHLPYSMCRACITAFFADKERITYDGKKARVTLELCESCTRGNMKLSQVYGKYFTSKTVSTLCVAIAVLCIPAICLHSIERVSLPTETTSALYRINLSGFGPLQACSLFKINLWLSGFFFKILPCAMMLIVTVALLRTLKQSKRCRTVLLADTRRSSSAGLMVPKERTTKIIVVLLTAFLFTELPQGLLSVVNALFPHEIQWFVYLNFGELLDILSLINCNTCFVVYVATSPRYRMSLVKVIKRLLGQAQTSAASLRLQSSQFVMRKISYV